MPVGILAERGFPGVPWWPPVVSSCVGAGLLGLLLVRRRTPMLQLCTWTFLANIAVMLFALWITSDWRAASPNWLPFQAIKLGTVAVSLLAPTLLVGLVSIVAFVSSSMIQLMLFPPSVQAHLPPGEFVVLLIYAIFAIALLVYRVRAVARQRALLGARAEAAAAQRLARAFLAIRDFSNSPLQTITLGLALLHRGQAQFGPIIERMERSLARLREL